MRLCGWCKRSDLTDHDFEGVLLYASNVLLGRQLTPMTQRSHRRLKIHHPQGFPVVESFCWVTVFIFFLITGYTLAELGVQCNLVIGNHKTLPCFLKCQQRTHQMLPRLPKNRADVGIFEALVKFWFQVQKSA